MLVSFDSLPDSSRIWVYQADQHLTGDQQETIRKEVRDFLNSWEAHGAPLKASFNIMHDRFLVIAVDEAAHPVTGCSTDAHVRFVQLLGQKLGINLFNRTQVALLHEGEVHLVDLKDLKEGKTPVTVGRETMTFNNLIDKKGQLNSEWVKPAGQTWLARYILQ